MRGGARRRGATALTTMFPVCGRAGGGGRGGAPPGAAPSKRKAIFDQPDHPLPSRLPPIPLRPLTRTRGPRVDTALFLLARVWW